MRYEKIWKKVLGPKEEIKSEFSVGNRYVNLWLVLGLLLGLAMLVVPPIGVIILLLVGFYVGFYLKAAHAYAFTDKRVLVHTGWLSTQVVSVDYEKITDVTVVEPFLDRIFTKSGHLAINTAGTDRHEVVLKHITAPYDVKKKLDELRS